MLVQELHNLQLHRFLIMTHFAKINTCTFYSYFWPTLYNNKWRFGLVGNVVGRINEVNQRWARLVLGWATDCKTCKPSWYVTSHPGQLSLAIPARVGKMITGDDYDHRQRRNGKFCVTVGLLPGLLAY